MSFDLSQTNASLTTARFGSWTTSATDVPCPATSVALTPPAKRDRKKKEQKGDPQHFDKTSRQLAGISRQAFVQNVSTSTQDSGGALSTHTLHQVFNGKAKTVPYGLDYTYYLNESEKSFFSEMLERSKVKDNIRFYDVLGLEMNRLFFQFKQEADEADEADEALKDQIRKMHDQFLDIYSKAILSLSITSSKSDFAGHIFLLSPKEYSNGAKAQIYDLHDLQDKFIKLKNLCKLRLPETPTLVQIMNGLAFCSRAMIENENLFTGKRPSFKEDRSEEEVPSADIIYSQLKEYIRFWQLIELSLFFKIPKATKEQFFESAGVFNRIKKFFDNEFDPLKPQESMAKWIPFQIELLSNLFKYSCELTRPIRENRKDLTEKQINECRELVNINNHKCGLIQTAIINCFCLLESDWAAAADKRYEKTDSFYQRAVLNFKNLNTSIRNKTPEFELPQKPHSISESQTKSLDQVVDQIKTDLAPLFKLDRLIKKNQITFDQVSASIPDIAFGNDVPYEFFQNIYPLILNLMTDLNELQKLLPKHQQMIVKFIKQLKLAPGIKKRYQKEWIDYFSNIVSHCLERAGSLSLFKYDTEVFLGIRKRRSTQVSFPDKLVSYLSFEGWKECLKPTKTPTTVATTTTAAPTAAPLPSPTTALSTTEEGTLAPTVLDLSSARLETATTDSLEEDSETAQYSDVESSVQLSDQKLDRRLSTSGTESEDSTGYLSSGGSSDSSGGSSGRNPLKQRNIRTRHLQDLLEALGYLKKGDVLKQQGKKGTRSGTSHVQLSDGDPSHHITMPKGGKGHKHPSKGVQAKIARAVAQHISSQQASSTSAYASSSLLSAPYASFSSSSSSSSAPHASHTSSSSSSSSVSSSLALSSSAAALSSSTSRSSRKTKGKK